MGGNCGVGGETMAGLEVSGNGLVRGVVIAGRDE
jgi:hypothetical protein